MPDQIDHIAELEKRLYARDPDAVPQRKFGILRPLKTDVDSSWGEKTLPEDKTIRKTRVSPYKRLFIASFIFFLIGIAVAAFSIYRGAITLSSKNVELSVLGNSFVGGGEALPIQVDISNKNADDLVDATITLSYPRGAGTLPGEIERIKKELGTIPSGKTKTEAFSIVLYGEQGSSRDVTATLEYKLSGANATFVKEKQVSVMISTSPVSLTVDAPTASASGQPFTITVRTTFTGDTVLENTVARIEYPNGFTFLGSSIPPSVGTNTWDLRDMVQGTERVISIKGRLAGEEQDEKTFRVYVGQRTSETDARIAVAYNSLLHSVVIAQPFLNAFIEVGGESTDIVALSNGSSINGEVVWENNTPLSVTAPQFTLDLLSEDIDPDTIDARGGVYDSLTRSITWNAESDTALATLAPGDKGRLPFAFSLKNSSEAVKEVALALSIRGLLPDRDDREEVIANIDQKTIRFASKLQFASQGLYSTGVIKNTGPFPPKVDKETTYTIVWTMRPAENPLIKATATATLPVGVTWAGVVVPQSEPVTFNPETRTISWTIGGMPKATTIPQVKTVSFQVKAKPVKNQVGMELTLLGETVVQATDSIANVPVTTSRNVVTTKLATDPLYSPGKEKVIP